MNKILAQRLWYCVYLCTCICYGKLCIIATLFSLHDFSHVYYVLIIIIVYYDVCLYCDKFQTVALILMTFIFYTLALS